MGRTSNFTDFAPLAIEPDVNVRLVRKLSDFGNPDLVIIPGSKSVISDLDYLKKSGLADKIIEKTKAGIESMQKMLDDLKGQFLFQDTRRKGIEEVVQSLKLTKESFEKIK